jgi:ribosomal protein S4
MPAARRAPLVALLTLLQRRFPGLDDPARLIEEGTVLVNGVPAQSPRTRVRADVAIQIRHTRLLRGTIKLAHALAAFGIDANSTPLPSPTSHSRSQPPRRAQSARWKTTAGGSWASSHHPFWEPKEQSKHSSTPHPRASAGRPPRPHRAARRDREYAVGLVSSH